MIAGWSPVRPPGNATATEHCAHSAVRQRDFQNVPLQCARSVSYPFSIWRDRRALDSDRADVDRAAAAVNHIQQPQGTHKARHIGSNQEMSVIRQPTYALKYSRHRADSLRRTGRVADNPKIPGFEQGYFRAIGCKFSFHNTAGAGAQWQLYSLNVKTGAEKLLAPVDLPASANDMAGFSLHPEGKRFLTSIAKWPYDIWMLEGFDQHKTWLDRLLRR